MYYRKVLKTLESTPHFSVGSDVGADFAWVSIILPNGVLIGRPFKIIHSDPQSRELAISKIKGAQGMYSLESRCFLESTGIYRILLLCFLRDKGFGCTIINPITTRNSTNTNVRKLRGDKPDSRKAVKVGLDAFLKALVVPNDAIINLRDSVHDYYYLKDLQSAIVLKFHAEFRVPFLAYPNVFSKVTTQTSLRLLEAYPLTADMLVAPKDELVKTIRNTARFGEAYALARYDTTCTAVEDAAVLKRILPSNTLRIGLYIEMYRGYQAHLDSILGELHQAVGRLEGTPDYDHISFIQTLHGVGFLNAVALVAEMGSFDPFPSPKRLYACFGLDPSVNNSGKFRGDRVHIFKQGSSLIKRILHMVAINNLKVGKTTKTPVNPTIYDYYTRKHASKKKNVAVRAIMHRICNIIFAMFRDNKPFELITPEEHRERYAAGRPESVNTTA